MLPKRVAYYVLYYLQGVTHRDVKPGNFLFSRMMNKGYLVDFNLAIVCEFLQFSRLLCT